MSEHTPTPWHDDDMVIFAANGAIARIPNHPENGRNWKADAAFIVKAVNNHEVLVAELKMARARIEYLGALCASKHFDNNYEVFLPRIDRVLAAVGNAREGS